MTTAAITAPAAVVWRLSQKCADNIVLPPRERTASIQSLSSAVTQTPSAKVIVRGTLPNLGEITASLINASRRSPSSFTAVNMSPFTNNSARRRRLEWASNQRTPSRNADEPVSFVSDDSDIKIKSFRGVKLFAKCAFLFAAAGDNVIQRPGWSDDFYAIRQKTRLANFRPRM